MYITCTYLPMYSTIGTWYTGYTFYSYYFLIFKYSIIFIFTTRWMEPNFRGF